MSLPPNYNLLKQYPNPVYIETGLYRGDGLHQAIEAGFKRIIGIDIDKDCIKFCSSRFAGNMELYCGDTADMLWEVIKDIHDPITFLLDAHWQLQDTEMGKNPFPLLKELAQIAKHPVKIHTIIIDDLLYMTHPEITGWDKGKINEGIFKINENYNIRTISNPVIQNMLIAWI